MTTMINIVFLIAVGGLAYMLFGPTKGLKSLTEKQFRDASAQSNLVIDVREPGEYRSGYIPGAVNIPLSQLKHRLDELPKDRSLLLYCRSGMRSKNAARILSKNGYKDLAHLKGGMNMWSGRVAR